MLRKVLLTMLVLTLFVAGCTSRARFAKSIPAPDWPEFSGNVKNYTVMVDELEKRVPPLPDKATAQQIVTHKTALADAVRKARSTAKVGDIFTPAVRDQFVHVVRTEVRGRAGRAAKTTIAEDNPGKGQVPLAVNALYPDAASLSSVPPTLLLRLPTLPETVEYRFVGKALVLRDVRANIVVDYIANALS